jgi:hypothetical protein
MIRGHRQAVVTLTLMICAVVIGCGRHSGGVVEETSEFTFDDIAATAAAETQESENASE